MDSLQQLANEGNDEERKNCSPDKGVGRGMFANRNDFMRALLSRFIVYYLISWRQVQTGAGSLPLSGSRHLMRYLEDSKIQLDCCFR